ncbi:MAG: hypothetical protein RMA76_17035 [Deltaproteobacteria bacterium]|jgi:hypothetical protein
MIRRLPLLLVVVALALPSTAFALPQFAALSARQCDNCHVEPFDWKNPELPERKCSLNCSTCHVNPTGGGMRNTAGVFYGREILAMFGPRPTDDWQPNAPSSRPASMPGEDEDVTAEVPPHSEPPGPLSAARYAGMDPTPYFRVGFDVRVMGYFPEDADNAFFPMQTDLYLAASPYNPGDPTGGRLTFLVNGGFLGSRSEEFDGFVDRAFVREYWALFDNLPYQLYGKLGQFLPAFGWRLDDHTAFIRQNQTFDNERQVTGFEVGLNPNYLYANASLFIPGPPVTRSRTGTERFSVLDFDNGFGTALTAGYRDLWWQAGGSFMFESRDGRSDLWVGANWALNLHEARHPWSPVGVAPVVYLGEYDLRHTTDDAAGSKTSLTSFHEVDFLVVEGLFLQMRYDWMDPDISNADDHIHRYTVGIVAHPFTSIEVIAQVRFNDEVAKAFNNETLVQLHAWF